MSDAKLVNIARLMTTYNFEIKLLPDDLKCAQCKLVLRSAFQGPCCCRYCRVCIDDMMARGAEFCPGDSEVCGESLLSVFVPDFVANKSVSILIVKCPNNGCVHECQLANMEKHLRECPRKNEECPFRELGCTQDKLAAEEMGGHLQHDNRKHSEILIEMIANINREIESLKRRDEVSTREIDTLKNDLVLKDGEIRSIMDQLILVQNENESIKNDIKSIKEGEKDLASRVRIVSEKIEREIAERRENDELESARVIGHVNREVAAVTELIESNKHEVLTEITGLRNDIELTDQATRSNRIDTFSLKLQMQSIQALVGLDKCHARLEWPIDADIIGSNWFYQDRPSEYFSGAVHPYKYRLRSWNEDSAAGGKLYFCLFIHAGPSDHSLVWPFTGLIFLTVTDTDSSEMCRTISQYCEIPRPPENCFEDSDMFEFPHAELIGAGLNLSRGVRMSCVIVPGAR